MKILDVIGNVYQIDKDGLMTKVMIGETLREGDYIKFGAEAKLSANLDGKVVEIDPQRLERVDNENGGFLVSDIGEALLLSDHYQDITDKTDANDAHSSGFLPRFESEDSRQDAQVESFQFLDIIDRNNLLNFSDQTFLLSDPLFTNAVDNVDFNHVTAAQIIATSNFYNALEGDDIVILPSAGSTPAVYDPANTFHGHSGNDNITGGDWDDTIAGGAGGGIL